MNWNETVNARGWKLPLIRKSLFQIGKDLRPHFDRVILRNSLIPDQALVDKDFFPWIVPLEQRWKEIRDEAIKIRAEDIPSLGDISFDHGRIAADRRWRAFFLKGYGYRMGRNCDRAPITTALIEKIPGLVTANFSVLEAGGHIPRHWGMTKAMLTYHLALKVPTDAQNCRMAIDDPSGHHVLPWQAGESFVFDDMYHHEVWNETEDDRYILLIQIKRPCRGMASTLQALFLYLVGRSRFVQDIRRSIDRASREHVQASQGT